MRWSQMLIPTLRENPSKEGSRALALMARAGYAMVEVGQIAAYLPLGQKCIRKIEELVRRRLLEKGGQEFSLRDRRALSARPSETVPEGEASTMPWTWGTRGVGEEERILREIASNHLRSYKELPQVWFYFAMRLSRVSQAYSVNSFFITAAHAVDASGDDPAGAALSSVVREYGLDFSAAQGAHVPPWETAAKELLIPSPDGEVEAVICRCGYSANLDCAISRVETVARDEASAGPPQLVETPDKKTIADVSEFLGVPAESVIKSLLYIIGGKPVLALVRGDDQLNEPLLCLAAGDSDARPATAEEIKALFRAEPGSIGPVGQTSVRILADRALRDCNSLVCGANKDGYHLIRVEPDRHFRAEYFDLRKVGAGDLCRSCGQRLSVEKAHSVMRSSSLSQLAPGAVCPRVLGADNKPHPLSVNIHRLHVDTLLLCLIEKLSDEDGVVLPPGIAPFDMVITPINYRDQEQRDVCDRIYAAVTKGGADVLLDDRECSPGVKFKDADLIGVPLRITVGPRKLKEGKVELRSRRTRECLDCDVGQVVEPAMKRFVW